MQNLELLEKERLYYIELENLYTRRLYKVKTSQFASSKKNTIKNLERLVSYYSNKLDIVTKKIYKEIDFTLF
jgi:hypothetical protein